MIKSTLICILKYFQGISKETPSWHRVTSTRLSVQQMYCSMNLWLTIILSCFASPDGDWYLSGYVVIELFKVSWTGQNGIAVKTRQVQLPVMNLFFLRKGEGYGQNVQCLGVQKSYLSAANLQWSLNLETCYKCSVLSLVLWVSLERRVSACSCSSRA